MEGPVPSGGHRRRAGGEEGLAALGVRPARTGPAASDATSRIDRQIETKEDRLERPAQMKYGPFQKTYDTSPTRQRGRVGENSGVFRPSLALRASIRVFGT